MPPGAGYVDATFLDSHLSPMSPCSPVDANSPLSLVYQAPSHFWPMQAIESGIFVVLAGALVVAAVRFTTRDAQVFPQHSEPTDGRSANHISVTRLAQMIQEGAISSWQDEEEACSRVDNQ